MAPRLELESLHVKLTGDNSQFVHMLHDSEAKLRGFASKAEKISRDAAFRMNQSGAAFGGGGGRVGGGGGGGPRRPSTPPPGGWREAEEALARKAIENQRYLNTLRAGSARMEDRESARTERQRQTLQANSAKLEARERERLERHRQTLRENSLRMEARDREAGEAAANRMLARLEKRRVLQEQREHEQALDRAERAYQKQMRDREKLAFNSQRVEQRRVEREEREAKKATDRAEKDKQRRFDQSSRLKERMDRAAEKERIDTAKRGETALKKFQRQQDVDRRRAEKKAELDARADQRNRSSTLSGIGALAGISMSAGFGVMLAKGMGDAISLAAQQEQSQVRFSALLGGDKAGGEMIIKQMQELSKTTPLLTSTLESGASMLLNYGVAGKDVAGILQMIAAVTGGDTERFKHMTLAFSQMTAAGRLIGNDLRQFATAGFNPLNEMARTTGVSMDVLKEKMSKGGISADDVRQAFRTATSSGGRFSTMLQDMSGTTIGSFARFQAEIQMILRQIGKDLIEQLNLKGFIKDLIEAAQWGRQFFTSLSSGTKTFIASLIAATVIILGIAAIITGILFVWNLMTGGVMLLVGLLVGAVVVLAGIIASVGGVGAAWAIVKQAAIDAWDWLLPTRVALMSLWDAILSVGTMVWNHVKAVAIGTWQAIFGSGEVAWDDLQQMLIEGIVAVEYALTNLPTVVELAWKSALLEVAKFMDKITDRFGSQIDTMVGALDILNPALAATFRIFRAGLAKNPIDELQKDVDKLAERAGADYQKLLEQRLFDIAQAEFERGMKSEDTGGVLIPPPGRGATDTGKKKTKQDRKVEATLFGSAEARSRITEYLDALQGDSEKDKIQKDQLSAQKKIEKYTEQIFKKPPINLVNAAFR